MTDPVARRLAAMLDERGLAAPARLLADAHRPLGPLLADLGAAIGPLLAAVGGARARHWAAALEAEHALDELVRELDAQGRTDA